MNTNEDDVMLPLILDNSNSGDITSSLGDDLPLYNGSNITVVEAVAKTFKWFTSHPSTSKNALSEMLYKQHSLLPKENILPKCYRSAHKLIQPLLLKPLVFHACPNDCILFRNCYAESTHCPHCKSPRYKQANIPNRKFIYLPLGPRIERMFKDKTMAKILQMHHGSSLESFTNVYDIQDSPYWKSLYSNSGIFKGDKRGISLAFCTDGVNPFSHYDLRVSYSMWPIMMTLLNLPRDRRNLFENILLLGIIPGNGKQEPKTLDPYLEVIVDELLDLQNKQIYDAYQEKVFSLKIEIILHILDYPGIGKVFKLSGSGAYKGCIWCDIVGMYISS